MSRFLSRRFANLTAYVPGEQPQDKKYIKLNTNESPYPPAPAVQDVLNAGAIADLRLYGDPQCQSLKETLADYLGTVPERIFVGNGSDEVLSFIFMAFCDRTTSVSYPDISYGFYSVFADLNGVRKNEVPLKADLTLSPSRFYCLETTIVLANPNAPTGLCLSVEDIESIVKANRNNVVVIDEAYIDFGGESCVELTKRHDNLLVVQTYSKSRSLAGARLGFAVGNSKLIADLEKLRFSTNPYNVNRLTMLAGIAAIEQQEYYDINNAKIVSTRETFSNRLQEIGFETTESKANFIFARHTKMGGKAIYEQLRDRGILVRHFDKPRIEDYLRITVGTPEEMEILCKSIKEVLKNA